MLPQAFVLCLNYLELPLFHTLVLKFLGPNPKQNIKKKTKYKCNMYEMPKKIQKKRMILFFNCKKKTIKTISTYQMKCCHKLLLVPTHYCLHFLLKTINI